MASPEPWLSISTNYHNCLSVQSEAQLPANDSQLASSSQPCPCNKQIIIPAVTLGAVMARLGIHYLLALLNIADALRGASAMTIFCTLDTSSDSVTLLAQPQEAVPLQWLVVASVDILELLKMNVQSNCISLSKFSHELY